jgi:hypothetical protein
MTHPGNDQRQAWLRIVALSGFEKTVAIDCATFSIGVAPDAALALPPGLAEESVTARHAVITREGETFLLTDESGSCGTRVNGRPVRHKSLSHGDVITLGKSELRIEFLLEESAEGVAAADRVRLLVDLLQNVHASLTVREISAGAVAAAMQLLRPVWAVVALDLERRGLEFHAAADRDGGLPDGPTRIAGLVMASGRASFLPSSLCVAIECRDGRLGVLDVGPRHGVPYVAQDLELLEALAAHAGVALRNARRLEGLPGYAATTGGAIV